MSNESNERNEQNQHDKQNGPTIAAPDVLDALAMQLVAMDYQLRGALAAVHAMLAARGRTGPAGVPPAGMPPLTRAAVGLNGATPPSDAAAAATAAAKEPPRTFMQQRARDNAATKAPDAPPPLPPPHMRED
jgi:hypothetical protein